jgi:hypothetical protein
MEKQCFNCKESKPLSEFYTHQKMSDGHLGKCKTCHKKYVADRVALLRGNPEWLKKERERCRLKQDRYRRLGLASKTSAETKLKWAQNNPQKIMAQKMAKAAFEKGLIKKPSCCEACGEIGKLEKHHPDYSKPLLIQWLCLKCHGKTRRKDEENFDIIP